MDSSEIEVVTTLRAAGCVFAEDEARLLMEAAGSGRELDELVQRRVAGTPLEYLLGWVEFHGIRVGVRAGVFVPRQRTTFLVDEAAALASFRVGKALTVVDLCCGSGALGLALLVSLHNTDERGRPAAEFVDGAVRSGTDESLDEQGGTPGAVPAVELIAADIDPVAVACARDNLAVYDAQVYQGDLFEALPERLQGRVDLLLANTPYVPSAMIARMPPEARDHEPATALDGGGDGLDIFRRVATEAAHWLAPGGHLLVEISEGQAETAAAVLADHALSPRIAHSPDRHATIAVGTKPRTYFRPVN
ncbi:SAM-dependent methyltransferase [Nocardia donostiensis]|uniref:HemK family protein methyltransferase n=1 Tax=Nocardia donostiensis TaxID=1538463 RepID=UPI0009DA63F9|nr:HemK family protein methyltransferase [Nocardia donostiensis]OQS15503.1 SAM-dependent methyltransferase [Nocardia donostiensis]